MMPRSRGRDESTPSGRDYTSVGGVVGGDSRGGGSGLGVSGGRRLFGGAVVEAGASSGSNGGYDGTSGGGLSLKRALQQGFQHQGGGVDAVSGGTPSLVSARYPPLEHLQNPPQPDPKVGRNR